MKNWLMRPYENKLSEIKTTLGYIHEVTGYIFDCIQNGKTLAELKFDGRDDLTDLIRDLKRDVEQLESMFDVTGLSRRYEIRKDEHGVECIHFLE